MFPSTHTKFLLGDVVRKTKGASWQGRVVGWYSTELTPEGYAVESASEHGSVQIYPAAALELLHRHKPKATKALYQWAVNRSDYWFIPARFYATEVEVHGDHSNIREVRRLDYTALEVPACKPN